MSETPPSGGAAELLAGPERERLVRAVARLLFEEEQRRAELDRLRGAPERKERRR